MLQYMVRRMMWAVVMLLLVIALVFVIFFVIPGGSGRRIAGASPVAVAMAGKNPRPDLVRNIEKRLGLDRPVHVQFGRYIKGVVVDFDFGYSYQTRQDVRATVFRRLPPTIGLALGASVVWLMIGIPIGIVSALRRRSIWDRASMVFALVGVSLPTFWLGLMAIFYFGSTLRVYRVGSYVGISEDPIAWIGVMWLPWCVLAVTFAAFYTRMVRGNLLEVQGEDYIRTARAKGLRERSVIRHSLRSALTPVVTMYGLDVGVLMGGAIITESIFAIPGIGLLAVNAIQSQDFPMIMGATLVASFFVIFMNILVDIAYAVLDPRVRYS